MSGDAEARRRRRAYSSCCGSVVARRSFMLLCLVVVGCILSYSYRMLRHQQLQQSHSASSARRSTHDHDLGTLTHHRPSAVQSGDSTLSDLGLFVLVDLATQQPSTAAQSLANCADVSTTGWAKKTCRFTFVHIFANNIIDRSSKFFYWHTLRTICNNVIIMCPSV